MATALSQNAHQKEQELYCICKRPYKAEEFMIECDKCKDWFHGSCVKLNEFEAQDIDVYHCPSCQIDFGPLVLKKRRTTHRHNYRELNDGINKPTYAGTMDFIRQLKGKKFADFKNNIVVLDNGYFISSEYLETNSFDRPILIKKAEGLGLALPPSNFSVFDVEQHVGSLREIHVIDVARQEDLRMKMREWTEYYNSPVRTKVLNVISLEFSKSDLSSLVSPPAVVREISWVENIWPNEVPEDSPHIMPLVQKYCLMGVKDCYTDFHVDFGGTSVWYHVFRGEKVFYLIEPTEENLGKYEAWVSSANQSQVFFGDKVSTCIRCSVKQGQTLFIPTGWIHAVMTPTDTLVFGGNFLHSINIGLQFKIYDLEKRLETPIKFQFPNYETTCWYAAKTVLRKMRDLHMEGVKIPGFLYKGIYDLIKHLKKWTSNKENFMKFHKYQVPLEINHLKLIKSLEKELKYDMSLRPTKSNSMITVPSIVMTPLPKAKSSPNKSARKGAKTVIKLKLTGPNPNLPDQSKSNTKKNENSNRANDVVKDSSGKKSKKKRDKKKKGLEKVVERQISSEHVLSKEGSRGLKLQVSNGKIKSESGESVISGKEFKPLVDRRAEYTTEDPLKLKLTLNTSGYTQLEDQDLEVAHLLSQFPGMDSRNSSTSGLFNMSSSSTSFNETSRDRPDQPIASPLKKSNSVMDQIEAAKNDLFRDGGERNAIFFDTQSQQWNPAKLKNDPDLDDGYRISEPLPKPKGNVKRNRSESDSDYDPDDEYYQDANFVYPRLTSTSDIDDDDFSWNPGQRTKKKVKKTLNPQSKLNSQLPGNIKPKGGSDFFKQDLKFDAQVVDLFHGNNSQLKSSNAASIKPDQQQQGADKKKDKEKDKEKVKKGNTTAKQRLGKLLKLDKLGGRYVR